MTFRTRTRPLPSTAQLLAPVAAGAALLLLAGGLSGCSAVMDALHKVHQEQHPTYDAAERDWVGVRIPAWIPEDAVELRNYATTDETQAFVLVASDSEPRGCAPAERVGLPFEVPDWAPEGLLLEDDGSLRSEVLRCGDYEVLAVDGGWAGWFAATEPGQTPQG